jgi:limonene-1,2-epoxide hydrolase
MAMDRNEKLVRDMFANLFTAASDYFNETSEFYIWGPGHPPAVGTEAMKKGFQAVIAPLSDINFEFHEFASIGDIVFSRRTDSFTVAGHRVEVGVVGYGVIGSDRKFSKWVDFFDLMPFDQFHLSPNVAGGVRKL